MKTELETQAEMAFAKEFNHTLHAYIDISGDLVAGTLLSQIVYWFTDTKDGKSKLRVKKSDGMWLVKTREDWYNEIRITPKQYDRAVKILIQKGLVETKLYKFNGRPVIHIKPIWDKLQYEIDIWKMKWIMDFVEKEGAKQENTPILPKGENPYSPKGKMEIDERVKSLTENTTEPTNSDYTVNSYITLFSKSEKSCSQEEEFDFNVVERQIDGYCINNNEEVNKQKLIDIFRYFYSRYRRSFRQDHYRLSQDKIDTVCATLLGFARESMGELDVGGYEIMIDGYFSTNFMKKCNYSIVHFVSGRVLENIFYKFLYQREDEEAI